MNRTVLTFIVLAPLTLPLVACGDDGSGSTTTSDATSEPGTSTTGSLPTTTGPLTTTTDPDSSTSGSTTTDSTSTDGTTQGPTTTTPTTIEPTSGEETGDPTTDGDEVLIVPGFFTPESVFWSADEQAWFVSNIGAMGMMDGDGFISKLNADGTVAEMQWASGLNNPAGLRGTATTLFNADSNSLVALDIKTGQVVESVVIVGAVFLNDVVIGPDDFVYTSDTFGNAIHRWMPGQLVTEVVIADPGLEAPNGLIFRGDVLYDASIGSIMPDDIVGHLFRVENGMATQVGDLTGKFDGIEVDGNFFLISDFTGKLLRVSADGTQVETLRDFAAQDGLLSAADIGFDPILRVVGLPDLVGGNVAFWTVPQP